MVSSASAPRDLQIVIHTDGGSRGNPGQAAIGVYAFDQSQQPVFEHAEALGIATNNVAEYTAIIRSLEILLSSPLLDRVEQVVWKLDSNLVVEQLNRNWQIKHPDMQRLAEQAWQLLSTLPCSYRITYVPRAQNKAADALVNQALDAAGF